MGSRWGHEDRRTLRRVPQAGPWVGHPIHKPLDLRAEGLISILDVNNLTGPHVPLIREVSRRAGVALGKELPVNVTGNTALARSSRVCHGFESSSSSCIVPQNDSIIALS
jgi:hypothetical protein